MEHVSDDLLINDSLIVNLTESEHVIVKTRVLRSHNAQVRLMQFDATSNAALSTEPVEVNGPGFAHVCYQGKKRLGGYERFLDNDAKPIGDTEMVRLNPRNPVDYAYARDLDSIMFEIEHVDMSELNLDQEPEYDFRIRHVAIAAPDYDRLVEFYSVLLEQGSPRKVGRFIALKGNKFDSISGLPNTELKMAFFHMRNMELEIAQYISHPTELPESFRPIDALGYNMIVFDVVDLNQAKDKLLSAGGSIETEPKFMDGGEIFFGRDPDGNLLGFQTLPADSNLSAQNLPDYQAR